MTLRTILGGFVMTIIATGCGKKADTPPSPTAPVATAPDVAPTPDAAPASDAAPQPTWSTLAGSVTLPTGIALRLLVKRADGSAGPSATLDIPDQNLKGGALTDFVDDGTTLSFVFAPPGAPPAARAVFRATREADGHYRGHLEQGGMKAPLELVPTDAGELAERNRPQTPKPPFPYPTEALTIAVDGGELACTLALPANASPENPAPALIMRTGSGAQDRDETLFEHRPFLLLADALAKAGVATLRCDDRGAGSSSPGRREDDLGVFEADARKMLGALGDRATIDPSKIGVLGHSEGAITAASLVAADAAPADSARGPIRAAFGVLLAGPGRSGREVLVHQNRDIVLQQGGTPEQAEAIAQAVDKLLLAIDADTATQTAIASSVADAIMAANPGFPESKEDLVARFVATNGEPWMRSFVKSDPRPHLAKAEVPVLALFGEKDVQVPVEHAAALEAALVGAKPTVEIVIVPGVNHLFQTSQTGAVSEYALNEETMRPEVVDRVTGWIARTVGLVKTDRME